MTDRPENVEDYDLEHLTDDLVGLLDHLGVEKAVFAGHDWGGFVVWSMAMRHPSRVAGVVGVNTPHLPRAPVDPIESARALRGSVLWQFSDHDFFIAQMTAVELARAAPGEPAIEWYGSEHAMGSAKARAARRAFLARELRLG